MTLSVNLPKTPDGRVYRFSPEDSAHPRHFVLGDVKAEIEMTPSLRRRMKLEPRSPQTVCPYSGIVADDKDFMHPDDQEAAIKIVQHAAAADIEDEFAKMIQGLATKSSRSSPIRIQTSTRLSTKPTPRFCRRDLMRAMLCDHCGRDYGVFAIGLFCPDCGAPNLRLHFAREIELVKDQVALAESQRDLNEELAYRLLGNAHEDVLTAFESTLKSIYIYCIRKKKPEEPLPSIGNTFQNVDRAASRFAEQGFNAFELLADTELETLRLNIQKRHIIGHNLSVVDDTFVARANEGKVGETVLLVAEDIRAFCAICSKVVDQLDSWMGGSPSPYIGVYESLNHRKDTMDSSDPDGLMKLDLGLSLLARKVALWIARSNSTGMGDYVDLDKMKESFLQSSAEELGEAIAELKMDGFIKTNQALSSKLPQLRPEIDLFLSFDSIALGTDSSEDIVVVANLMLEARNSISVRDIFSSAGWNRRRFNPIFSAVIAEIDERHVSQTMDPDFPARGLFLADDDRVALKRLIGRVSR